MIDSYKVPPSKVILSDLKKKESLSAKDYYRFVEPEEYRYLCDIVEPEVGDGFLSTDFLTEDISTKYRVIKTGNLSPYKLMVDFSSVEYCKPIGNEILKNEDILIAKDGGTSGLGDAAIYLDEGSSDTDYISGEVLRVRVKEDFNKWYLLAVLKSKNFKEYLDVVTPGGSTLRHSKLLALNYKVPYPSSNQQVIDKIGILARILVDKEKQIIKKKKEIDEIFNNEINENTSLSSTFAYKQPKISEIKDNNRIDTGVYTKEYKELLNKVINYEGGIYYLNAENVYPGRTPDDYKYIDLKTPSTCLWITPKNIGPLELLYDTYVHTRTETKVQDFNIILSGIRYVGYGYLVDKGQKVYCNQNTVIVNYSNDRDEQIYLLCYFCSSIGRRFQMAWRVDGMVPIIYRDDFVKIPIPDLTTIKREEIVRLYYNDVAKLRDEESLSFETNKERNAQLGIYQLNYEILNLRTEINKLVDSIIRKSVSK